MRSLVWLRSDLRTDDSSALHHAAAAATRGLAALYVLSPGDFTRHDTAAVRVDWILRTLAALSQDLAALNLPLLVRTAPTWQAVPELVAGVAKEISADAVYVNREYEVNERRRDERTAALLAAQGRAWHAFHDQTILPPADIRTQADGPFTVFSPFKRAFLKLFTQRDGSPCLPAPGKQPAAIAKAEPVPAHLHGWTSTVDPALWPAGQAAARQRLDAFIATRLSGYKDGRDMPVLDATSSLSPHLAVGVISPRRCFNAALAANAGRLDTGDAGALTWMSELIWREFYKHVLVHFPRVCMGRAFKPETDKLPWRTDPDHLRMWQIGRTGYPIVDAAQRQLLATGWMHNRLRMISAMFLSKDLFLDWRLGERYFMQHLIDGDLASNNGGWQWSASTGTDAAPYFRIFNPMSQSRRFDPDGTFIRRWVPELRDVQGDSIHAPTDPDDKAALPMLLRSGLDYPEPIVSHAEARDRVLAAFKVNA